MASHWRVHEPIEPSEIESRQISSAIGIEKTLQALQGLISATPDAETINANLSAAVKAVQESITDKRSDGLRIGLENSEAETKHVKLAGEDLWQLASAVDENAQIQAARVVLTKADAIDQRIRERSANC